MSEATSIHDLIRQRNVITRELGQKIDELIREAICIRTGNAKNHFRTKYIPREIYDLLPKFVQLAHNEITLINKELFVNAVSAYRNRTGASLLSSKMMIDSYRESYKNLGNTNQEHEPIVGQLYTGKLD